MGHLELYMKGEDELIDGEERDPECGEVISDKECVEETHSGIYL